MNIKRLLLLFLPAAGFIGYLTKKFVSLDINYDRIVAGMGSLQEDSQIQLVLREFVLGRNLMVAFYLIIILLRIVLRIISPKALSNKNLITLLLVCTLSIILSVFGFMLSALFSDFLSYF